MVKELQLADKQMDAFTRDDLDRMLAEREGWCVSLFMPAERRGIVTKGNPVRFKNLLDEAELLLKEAGVRDSEIHNLLAPANARIRDTWFWQHQSAGLAAFAAPGEFLSFRLPLNFDEQVDVARQFSVGPLLPLLSGDGKFFVLALAKGGVRLLECVRHTFAEVELTGVPTNLPEELRYDIFINSFQHHTASTENGVHIGMWHGHGATSDEANLKQRVKEFCRHLENGVHERLGTSHAPLVLAGLEYLRGFYREANHYDNLMEEDINISAENVGNEILHRRAWEIVEPVFSRAREQALALYLRRAGSGENRVGNQLPTVLPAAFHKRVDTLFVPQRTRIWGTFDPETYEVAQHAERQPGDVDLLNLAVSQVFRNNGMVYCLHPEAMPDRAPVAALFRF